MIQKKLSIIIPAYNEERRIRKTLEDYLSTFRYDNVEIIVIPNFCNDQTESIVQKLQKIYPKLRFKSFSKRILKGGAILEGFKIAHGQYIGYVDADGSTDAKEYKSLFQKINSFDGVIASRKIMGSKILKKAPLKRQIASKIFNIFVRFCFHFSYKDTQCGAKIFTKKTIQKIEQNICITNWAFDIDLLYQAKKNGFQIREVPTVWSYQTNSKLQLGQAGWKMFLSVLKLRILYSPFKFLILQK